MASNRSEGISSSLCHQRQLQGCLLVTSGPCALMEQCQFWCQTLSSRNRWQFLMFIEEVMKTTVGYVQTSSDSLSSNSSFWNYHQDKCKNKNPVEVVESRTKRQQLSLRTSSKHRQAHHRTIHMRNDMLWWIVSICLSYVRYTCFVHPVLSGSRST